MIAHTYMTCMRVAFVKSKFLQQRLNILRLQQSKSMTLLCGPSSGSNVCVDSTGRLQMGKWQEPSSCRPCAHIQDAQRLRGCWAHALTVLASSAPSKHAVHVCLKVVQLYTQRREADCSCWSKHDYKQSCDGQYWSTCQPPFVKPPNLQTSAKVWRFAPD